MNADGSNLLRLSSAKADYGDHLPVWSPDGTVILFTRDAADPGVGDLYRVPSAGGTPELVLLGAIADW
jgi:Tol biopolymer transport system component